MHGRVHDAVHKVLCLTRLFSVGVRFPVLGSTEYDMDACLTGRRLASASIALHLGSGSAFVTTRRYGSFHGGNYLGYEGFRRGGEARDLQVVCGWFVA